MIENGKTVLVIGGGIAGITAAIEAAEAGCSVILLEKSASLGGRVARSHQYFPKLCPPGCGLEINYRRIKNNPGITVLTLAELEQLSGNPGDFEATVRISPRYVMDSCTLCDACARACPAEREDDFNYGLSKTKAAFLPHSMAFPALYAIDRAACKEGCKACAEVCAYGAIDLGQQLERRKFKVAAVVAATGWDPYDASRIDNLGFSKHANVVTNTILERLAASDGPTGGKILRPSDGAVPQSIAFVQCAGSRDENHLPYCSSVCCAASLKQATYIRALYPEASISIYYIDIRTPGRLEDFLARIKADERIELIKGKVGKVEADPRTGDLLVTAEEVLHSRRSTRRYSLLVLATGIVPQTNGLPPEFTLDEFGFIRNNPQKVGFYGAGCVHRPEEVSTTVQDATGAALKALQCAVRSARHG
jgi:quinone-modifying oxidoreductase subunit QmoA